MPDGNGFMAGVLAPGGCIYRINPEGTEWELISIGYRNPYDIAFNRDGELFTYDADMEWDINTPWYRPTRINHVVSGSDYGWRNGTGKFPPYYIDTLPAAVDIGPGSPTGITFGYGADVPREVPRRPLHQRLELRQALRRPPRARRRQLHRDRRGVHHRLAPAADRPDHPPDRRRHVLRDRRPADDLGPLPGHLRRRRAGPRRRRDRRGERPAGASAAGSRPSTGSATAARSTEIWPYLGHPDRFIRYAARVAIEFQENEVWQSEALTEPTPAGGPERPARPDPRQRPDPDHRRPDDPPVNLELKGRILQSLDRLTWDALTPGQRIDQQRVYAVLFNRMGPPDAETRSALLARFEPHYPTGDRILDAELTRLLVYLQSPEVAAEAVARLEAAPTQEEQIQYAQMLRVLEVGWTPELRERYFQLVRQGRPLPWRRQLRQLHPPHPRRRGRRARSTPSASGSAPILEAGRGPGVDGPDRQPAVRPGLDARRAGPRPRSAAWRTTGTSVAAVASSPRPTATPATDSPARAAPSGPT